jgi:hypothetical protein
MPDAALSSVSAPTAIVLPSPLSASETAELIAFAKRVRRASFAVFEALTYACCVHADPDA